MNMTIKYRQRKHQAGGTLLGLIIGLIIGLAIAVIVAVAITKTPMPFLNKSGKAEKAPELTAGQSADPNKPMYGNKEAVKEAAKDFAKETITTLTADGLKTTEKPVAKPAEVKPADSKSTDSKPAETKSADSKDAANLAAAKPDAAEDKWLYYLQAGAFHEQADAENTRAKLALQGFEASIMERGSDSGALYRVRLGPYTQIEAMNRVRNKLSDNGIDIAVVRVAK